MTSVLARVTAYLDATSAAPCPALPTQLRAPVLGREAGSSLDRLVRQTKTRLTVALRKATPAGKHLPSPVVWSPAQKSDRFRSRVKFRVPCMTAAQIEAVRGVAKSLKMSVRVYRAGDGTTVEGTGR